MSDVARRMWQAVMNPKALLLVLLTYCALSAAEEDNVTFRLEMQAVKLNELTARLLRLTSQLDTKLSEETESKMAVLDFTEQLKQVPGTDNTCQPGSFQCGSDSLQCVSDILVCDGSADCKNGYDEHQEICAVAFKEGGIFQGTNVFNECHQFFNRNYLAVYTGLKQNPLLASRPQVEIDFIANDIDLRPGSLDHQYHVHMHRLATYSYGSKSYWYDFTIDGISSFYSHCMSTGGKGSTIRCLYGRQVLRDTDKPCMEVVFRLT